MNDWYDTSEMTLDRETVRDLIDQASPGPAKVGRMAPEVDPVAMFSEFLGGCDGHVWGVALPEDPRSINGYAERPDHVAVTCWTGNGPTSLHNARLYAAAPRLGAALLDAWDVADELREDARFLRAEVERLRQIVALSQPDLFESVDHTFIRPFQDYWNECREAEERYFAQNPPVEGMPRQWHKDSEYHDAMADSWRRCKEAVEKTVEAERSEAGQRPWRSGSGSEPKSSEERRP